MFRLSSIFCFLLFLAVLNARPALALDVTALRLGVHSDKIRLVVELSGPADFRAFMMDGPMRLMFDLPATQFHAKIPSRKGTFIKQIRQGPLLQAKRPTGLSRLVIDLDRPALIQSAFAIPAKDGQPDKIVIDFAAASAAQFSAGKDRVFGSLRAQAGAPQDRPPAASPQIIPPVKKPLIVIDAGHGGDDPGAPGPNDLHEKNITLAMAKDLKAHLEDTGRYRVILTRSTDVFIRLGERVAFARRHNADLFVSLHADSISKPDVRGASIYTLSETASDKETEKLAARENRADAIAGLKLDTQDEDVANILVDLAMRDTMNQSKFFANTVVRVLNDGGVVTLERPHRSAGFAVLKAPDIPSVLIETGYMSNDREATMLSTPAYRSRIATALVSAIDGYFSAVKRTVKL